MKLLYFKAGWCDPCHKMNPIVEEIFNTNGIKDQYSLECFDVDENPELAFKMKINSLPTFVILDEQGKEKVRHTGLWPKNKMIDWMADALYQTRPAKLNYSIRKGTNMRKVRAQFELTKKGQDVDRRYIVTVGDGVHSQNFTLAPHDQFSDHRWDMLLGESSTHCEWISNTDEGMYITITRQYVNPNFDFSMESYRNYEWLIADPVVSQFRLYNPWIGKPFLSWAGRGKWGNDVSFSEGDTSQFAWGFSNWDPKIEEKDVQYTVHRFDDSDNFKEFIIKLD